MLDALVQSLQNPTVLAVLAIQFLLGLSLGYIAVKALKYVLAFIVILVLGVILNVWSLGLSLEDLISKLSEHAAEAKNLFFSIAGTLGLLTVGPVTVGFLVGALISWLRR
jgi:hypothetical protein